MDTVLVNSVNSKIFNPRRLLLLFWDKINLERQISMLLYQISASVIHRKI